MADADAAVVLAENHIERPVLAALGPGCLHRLVQRAQVGAHHAASRLLTTVAFEDFDVLLQPVLPQALCLVQECRPHRLCQIGLVVLDRDAVVGLLLADLLDDLALASRCVVVMVVPLMSSNLSNCGTAMISLLLSAVLTCPSVAPTALSHAETRRAIASMPLREPRKLLPSTWIAWPRNVGHKRSNQHAPQERVGALAREFLNDWEVIMRPLSESHLPLTNSHGERQLRHHVLARLISHGTCSDTGTPAYACLTGLLDTRRRRGSNGIGTLGCKSAAAPELQFPALSESCGGSLWNRGVDATRDLRRQASVAGGKSSEEPRAHLLMDGHGIAGFAAHAAAGSIEVFPCTGTLRSAGTPADRSWSSTAA